METPNNASSSVEPTVHKKRKALKISELQNMLEGKVEQQQEGYVEDLVWVISGHLLWYQNISL